MMSSPPNQTARLARRAAGRIRLARTLRLAGRGLVVGAAAALLTAAAGKALPLDQTVTITIAAVSAGVALLASAAIGLTRRVTDTEGAGRLDESLRLHDRFTTAVELSEAPHRSVFGELALAGQAHVGADPPVADGQHECVGEPGVGGGAVEPRDQRADPGGGDGPVGRR